MESDKESETDKHSSKDTNDSRNKDDAIAPQFSVQDSDHDHENEADKKSSGSAEKSEPSHTDADEMLKKSSTSPVFFPDAQEDSRSPKKTEKDETPGDLSSKELSDKSPSDHVSQVSQATDESILQTPPIQVMDASGDYDPNRIPASVFGSRPSSAMDWSVASNESLFSLHLGNNSFSREQFLMMSGELNYDELNKSGELNKPHDQDRSGLPPLSPVGKLQNVKSMDSDKKNEQTKAADESPKDSLKLDVEEKEHELDWNGGSSFYNRPSDGSTASCQSFAFPILVDTNTTKSSFGKGPSPRRKDMSPVVESPKMEAQANNSSSYNWCCCSYSCCSLPYLSCASCNSFWSWKWCKKWCCCCCCCCCSG